MELERSRHGEVAQPHCSAAGGERKLDLATLGAIGVLREGLVILVQ